MQRKEAIDLLKIFSEIHKDVAITSVDLISPYQSGDVDNGYQINLKSVKFHTLEDLKVLLGGYGFTAKEDKDTIIVFKPK